MENHEPVIVIDQKESTKKRGTLAIILAIAFVAILGIGGTFAYLTWTTNQTPNRVTTDPVVTADLLEPLWTAGAKASSEAAKDEDKGVASDGEYIPKNADNMLPGVEVAKNPFIVNTSKNGSKVYAGMKMQFQKWVATDAADKSQGKYVNMTDAEVNALLAVYAIYTPADDATDDSKATQVAGLTPGTGWTEIADSTYTAQAGSKYFYYAPTTSGKAYDSAIEALPSTWTSASETASDAHWSIDAKYRTTDLFTAVRMVNGATQDQINTLRKVLNSKIDGDTSATDAGSPSDPGWRVVLSGAAIQATTDKAPADFISDTTVNWKSLCDANTKADDTTASAKPNTATGIRTDFTTGQYTSKNAGAVKGIPEATNVKPDGN
jgi:predicted ribosomally synthesized peptide with SipW-like signal peptide